MPPKDDGKINVVSVIFPSYDFVRVISEGKVNSKLLLPPGAESHSYEPSPMDMVAIMGCDLFIHPGGESSKWVDRILESIKTSGKQIKVLKLMDLVDAVEEEVIEGMEDDGDSPDAAPVYDEHVWTSPKNAKLITASIAEALMVLDPANAEFYRQNAVKYTVQLDELDALFASIVEGAKRRTIIFGDRYPFRYFSDAYALEYFAAFPGCSAETEPSASTIAFLINKIKNEQIPVIFYIELSNEKMADTISEETGAKKLLLHSCHNISKKDFENGGTYLDFQKMNAEHLKEALW